MKNYITDINLQDDNFFLYYNNGRVKTIPFYKFDNANIKKIISIFEREKDIVQQVKKRLKLFLFSNIIVSFIIIAISVIIYNLLVSSIIIKIMAIILGINFSIVNLISTNINYHELNKVDKRTIPSIDSQLEILNQQIEILEEIKKDSNIIEFTPFHKKKILTKNSNLNDMINYQDNDKSGKILTFKKR